MWRRAVLLVSAWLTVASLVPALAGFTFAMDAGSPGTARAFSCFVIVGGVTCIDAGHAPGAPGVPPVIAPIGPIFGGEDNDIVMSDNGGYVVERG